MSEGIEFAFSGDFHYAYRDLPLRPGESLVNPSVVERGRAFTRGNDTALEPGTPGTFGVERRGDTVRIVWHFSASDQTRAFTVSYTLRGVAIAYDDESELPTLKRDVNLHQREIVRSRMVSDPALAKRVREMFGE